MPSPRLSRWNRPRSRARLAGLVAALLAGPVPVLAQDAPPSAPAVPDVPPADVPTFGERLEITAVTVAVRATENRKPVTELRAEDFELREDGVACPVVAVERVPPASGRVAATGSAAATAATAAPAAPAPAPPSRPWRVLIYVDLQLAGVTSVRLAAWELGGRAEELAALGEVEIWVADDDARRVLAPSQDAEQIRKTLRKTVADNFGQRRMLRLREKFLQDSNQSVGLANRRGNFGETGSELGMIRAFAMEEAKTLELRRSLLERVLTDRSVPDWPQAALVVTGGYDLAPGEFYLPKAAPDSGADDDAQRLASDFERWSQAAPADRAARQMAALGWTVVSILPYDQAASFRDSAQFDGSAAWSRMRGGSSAGGISSAFLLLHPEDPWKLVGEATGGEVVTDLRQIDDALARLADHWLVTYQVSRRKDGSLRRLELQPRRAGLALEAPDWVAAGAPEAVAATRAKALLAGGEDRGELPVAAEVAADAADERGQSRGRIRATVEFAPLEAVRATLASTTLRFTIAVPRPDGTVLVIHERAEHADVARRPGWRFEAQVVAPKGTPRVAVVVEELATGAWGGALANWGG